MYMRACVYIPVKLTTTTCLFTYQSTLYVKILNIYYITKNVLLFKQFTDKFHLVLIYDIHEIKVMCSDYLNI